MYALLTHDHICARLQFAAGFASEHFQRLRGHPFVFTDESRFACGHDCRLVWCRAGEAPGLSKLVNPLFSATRYRAQGRQHELKPK
jgi:hypothetical protein